MPVSKRVLKSKLMSIQYQSSITDNKKCAYKAIVIKTACCWKNTNIKQWKKIENKEISHHTISQLFYYNKDKTTQWRKDISLTSGAGKAGQQHVSK